MKSDLLHATIIRDNMTQKIKQEIPAEILKVARNVRRLVLRESANDGTPGSTCGWCEFASLQLICRLEKLGYKPVIQYGFYNENAHCWVLVCGHILDVTSDQFDGPCIA